MQKREPNKLREWEKQRRNRLKNTYTELGKLLPTYLPSKTATQIDIIEGAIKHIQELQNKVNNLLAPSENVDNKTEREEIQKLTTRVERLIEQNDLLKSLLQDAGISIPIACGSISEKAKKWSIQYKKSKMLAKMEIQKENNPKKINRKKQANKNVKSKKLKVLGNNAKLVKKSKKVVLKNGKLVTGKPSALITLNSTPPCYIINSVDTTVAANTLQTASFIQNPSKSLATALPTNTSPLNVLKGGTLIFPSGKIVSVLSQPTVQIPKQTIIPTNQFINQTNQQQIIVQNSQSLNNNTTLLVVPPNTQNVVVSSKNKVLQNKTLPKIRPKRRINVTNTTQVNKVPIPALTSKYSRYNTSGSSVANSLNSVRNNNVNMVKSLPNSVTTISKNDRIANIPNIMANNSLNGLISLPDNTTNISVANTPNDASNVMKRMTNNVSSVSNIIESSVVNNAGSNIDKINVANLEKGVVNVEISDMANITKFADTDLANNVNVANSVANVTLENATNTASNNMISIVSKAVPNNVGNIGSNNVANDLSKQKLSKPRIISVTNVESNKNMPKNNLKRNSTAIHHTDKTKKLKSDERKIFSLNNENALEKINKNEKSDTSIHKIDGKNITDDKKPSIKSYSIDMLCITSKENNSQNDGNVAVLESVSNKEEKLEQSEKNKLSSSNNLVDSSSYSKVNILKQLDNSGYTKPYTIDTDVYFRNLESDEQKCKSLDQLINVKENKQSKNLECLTYSTPTKDTKDLVLCETENLDNSKQYLSIDSSKSKLEFSGQNLENLNTSASFSKSLQCALYSKECSNKITNAENLECFAHTNKQTNSSPATAVSISPEKSLDAEKSLEPYSKNLEYMEYSKQKEPNGTNALEIPNKNLDVLEENQKHLESKNLQELAHSELSNDIFASLQVPTGGQNPESTSPTAAFLLAFPLVSSLTGVKVTEVIEEETNDSRHDTPTLLQIGTMENTKTTQTHTDSLTPGFLNLDNFAFFNSKDIFYHSLDNINVNDMKKSSITNTSIEPCEKTHFTPLNKITNNDDTKQKIIYDNIDCQNKKDTTMFTYNTGNSRIHENNATTESNFLYKPTYTKKNLDLATNANIKTNTVASNNCQKNLLQNSNKNVITTTINTPSNSVINRNNNTNKLVNTNANTITNTSMHVNTIAKDNTNITKNVNSANSNINTVTNLNTIINTAANINTNTITNLNTNANINKHATSTINNNAHNTMRSSYANTQYLPCLNYNVQNNDANTFAQNYNLPIYTNANTVVNSVNSSAIAKTKYYKNYVSSSTEQYNTFNPFTDIPKSNNISYTYKNTDTVYANYSYNATMYQMDANATNNIFDTNYTSAKNNGNGTNKHQNIYNVYDNYNSDFAAGTVKINENDGGYYQQALFQSSKTANKYAKNSVNVKRQPVNWMTSPDVKISTDAVTSFKDHEPIIYGVSNAQNYLPYANTNATYTGADFATNKVDFNAPNTFIQQNRIESDDFTWSPTKIINDNHQNAGFSTKVLENTNFATKVMENTNFNTKAMEHMNFKVMENTKGMDNTNFNTKGIGSTNFSTKVSENTNFNTNALENASFNAKIHENASFNTKIHENTNFNTKIHESSNFNTKINENTNFNTKLHESNFNAKINDNTTVNAKIYENTNFNTKVLETTNSFANTNTANSKILENSNFNTAKLCVESNFPSVTLPTLVGDLALENKHNTHSEKNINVNNTSRIKERRNKLQSYENTHNNNSGNNILSVSQLVDHNKNSESIANRIGNSRRNSGNRNKKATNKKHAKDDSSKNMYSNKNKYENWDKNNGKSVKNNYSAEALIGAQNDQIKMENNRQNTNFSSTNKNTSIAMPFFSGENIISYFPPMDVQTQENNFATQNAQNYPISNNTFVHGLQNTTNYLSTPSVGNSFHNSFISDLNHDFPSMLSDNFFALTTAHVPTTKKLNSKANNNSGNKISGGVPHSKNASNGNNKALNLNLSLAGPSGSKKKSLADVPTYVDFGFLPMPGAINSPILPDDFHTHTNFLGTPGPYSCKNSLGTDLSAPSLLPPIPSVSRSSIQHPEISPSIGGSATSLTNFNLSTIFPEINKSSFNLSKSTFTSSYVNTATTTQSFTGQH